MRFIKNKICVFDFDGVIGDSRELGYEIHNSIRKKYKLPSIESQNDYLKIIDDSHLKDFLDVDTIRYYYLECNKNYGTHLKEIEIFPAIKELLQNAKTDIIIISSSLDSFIIKILSDNGIERITVYGKEKAKSKKERFEMLLVDKNISKEDIIYIGDTIDDYHFCEQMGISMVGVNYGYSNLSEIKNLLLDLKEKPEELVELVKPYM